MCLNKMRNANTVSILEDVLPALHGIRHDLLISILETVAAIQSNAGQGNLTINYRASILLKGVLQVDILTAVFNRSRRFCLHTRTCSEPFSRTLDQT